MGSIPSNVGIQVNLAHCYSRRSLDSPTTGIRTLVRLGGERDPSVDQASDVGDSYLRGRLLGFKCE
ncbi:hypothetical protein MTR_7g033185 [Medicago truncatula]|uniref:Uncharacterized protein n=1 Tax=Medicago truncatula TaxID=3880 RepID=A0A072U8B5_MEDTR|nr:hypothetical protein MTR_7g033185 [Medicago truncatula]